MTDNIDAREAEQNRELTRGIVAKATGLKPFDIREIEKEMSDKGIPPDMIEAAIKAMAANANPSKH